MRPPKYHLLTSLRALELASCLVHAVGAWARWAGEIVSAICLLRAERVVDSVHPALELGKHAWARRVDATLAIVSDPGVEQFGMKRAQAFASSNLMGPIILLYPNDIGRQYRRQSALHPRFGHNASLRVDREIP